MTDPDQKTKVWGLGLYVTLDPIREFMEPYDDDNQEDGNDLGSLGAWVTEVVRDGGYDRIVPGGPQGRLRYQRRKAKFPGAHRALWDFTSITRRGGKLWWKSGGTGAS